MNKTYKKKIAVIGGGASGIMATHAASLNKNCSVDLFERNEKLGKKIFITGKGRCNVTNNCSSHEFFKNITKNEKFFYSSFYTFDNNSLMHLIEENGTPLKTERGNRVFPVSDKSSDILRALNSCLSFDNITIHLNCKINNIEKNEDKFKLDQSDILYDSIIITGGGMSYPVTGSDGNTYNMAKKLGHSITNIESGLCGIDTADMDTHTLSGLSLKNVTLCVQNDKKIQYKEIGEMEFTHFGVSGPLILSVSSLFSAKDYKKLKFNIDLKQGLEDNQLEKRIIRDIETDPNKSVKNTLGKLLPIRLMEAIFNRSGIDSNKKCNQLTKQERTAIIKNIKSFNITPIKLRPVEESIITRGGVDCSEINPSTLESKISKGLYFAGEILDIDALTGGYNLQIAFSTGYLAGLSASNR